MFKQLGGAAGSSRAGQKYIFLLEGLPSPPFPFGPGAAS